MKLDSRLAATTWEFENRALALGVLFSVAFMWSAFDPQNVTVALAHALSDQLQADGDRVARTLFALAAVVVSTAALSRTWASAYLKSGVVYASALKAGSLVADGPYRHTRNPLYLGNVLMAVGMGDGEPDRIRRPCRRDDRLLESTDQAGGSRAAALAR